MNWSQRITVIALAGWIGAAPAQTAPDPLWARARLAMDASHNLVASQVATDVDIFDGGKSSFGRMHLIEQISEWKNGEPVRVIVSNDNPEGADLAKVLLKVSEANHPDLLLHSADTVTRQGSAFIDGRPCALFGLNGRAGKALFKGTVWIDEGTALPLKIVKEFNNVPVVKSLTQTILYGRSKDGQWLPASALVEANASILFKTLRMVSKHQYNAWIARPAP